MKINILGGGPVSLYFSVLMNKRDPAHLITIFERDGRMTPLGVGIVFLGRTFQFLEENDAQSHAQILARSQTWEDVIIGHPLETIAIGGNAFSGIARLTFLNILQQRCLGLGSICTITPTSQRRSCRRCVSATCLLVQMVLTACFASIMKINFANH